MLAWISCIQTRSSHDDKGEEVAINKDLILKKSSQIELGYVSGLYTFFCGFSAWYYPALSKK